MSAKCPRVSRLPCHKVWATDPEFADVRKLRNSRNSMQIAGSSGSADITELANWHNYNYLPARVNTTPDFLTPYITTGYDQRATAVPSTPSILIEEPPLWLDDASALATSFYRGGAIGSCFPVVAHSHVPGSSV